MQRSKKSLTVLLAGSLSVLGPLGCAAPVTPTVGTAASQAPAATPAAAASKAPGSSTAPTAGSSPQASDKPATGAPVSLVSAPPPGGKTTILSGTVYDEDGAPVDGASVTVTSLDASVPYTATTTTRVGSWVVNSVPEGANVDVVATKSHWTSRDRVGSYQASAAQKNVLDFGGTSDPTGVAFFISAYPEVATVVPDDDTNEIDPSTVSYVLTLSEPLDATNQSRFANALRLMPANAYAAPDNDGFDYTNTNYAAPPANWTIASRANSVMKAGDDTTLAPLPGANVFNLDDQTLAPFGPSASLDRVVDPDASLGYTSEVPAGNTATQAGSHPYTGNAQGTMAACNVPWDYTIKSGTQFLNDTSTRASVSWDATGQTATFTFKAPLQADRRNIARYQLGLVATSPTERIVDATNHQLGVDAQGDRDQYPAAGALIHATIKQDTLAVSLPSSLGAVSPGAARWIATHFEAARFGVKIATTAPKLASAAFTKGAGASSRFELTFQDPIVAYNGRAGGHVGAAIASGDVLNTLSFAVSDRVGGAAKVGLSGGPGYGLDPLGTSLFASQAGSPDFEVEFGLGHPMAAATMGGSLTAPVTATDLLPYGTDIHLAETLPANRGKYLLAVSPTNPRTLFVYVVGVSSVFDARVIELAVRAEAVPDAAGNVSSSDDADKQQVVTSVQ